MSKTTNKPSMKTSAPQTATQDASPFQFDPFALVGLLTPKQRNNIAGEAFTSGQLLFKKGRYKDYKEFLSKTFKTLFESDAFLSLDADTRCKQVNMAIELICFLSRAKDLDRKVNNQVVRAVMGKTK